MVLNIPFYRCGRSSGVERNLAKVDVEGSNPFTRSNSNWVLLELLFINKSAEGIPFTGNRRVILLLRVLAVVMLGVAFSYSNIVVYDTMTIDV